MKRLLVGLVCLLSLLLAAAFVVPLLLPKDAIRAELIAQIEQRTGWRLRLDGPVGLSLLPGFRLTAEDVGISVGGAGEFARAGEVDFGLAWGGLFGGEVRLTHVALERPAISLEIGEDGQPNWGVASAAEASGPASGAGFPVDRWSAATQAISESNSEGGAESAEALQQSAAEASGGDGSQGAEVDGLGLARIGVDRLTIEDGSFTYLDRRNGARQTAEAINVTLRLPALSGPLDIDGELTLGGLGDGVVLEVAGALAAPLRLANGGSSGIDLTIDGAGARATATGDVGLGDPSRLRVAIEGESLGETLAALGSALPRDPGAYRMNADIAADAARIDIASLTANVAGAELRMAGNVAIGGAAPVINAGVEISKANLATLLTLAGRAEEARGTIGGSLKLSASGGDMATLLGTLDASGRLSLSGGGIDKLPVPAPLGEDAGARRIDDLALALDFAGLDAPVSLTGGLTWRGETFSVEGSATPALMMAGMPAPTRLRVSGSHLKVGYDGALSPAGDIDGDVVLETANLRALAAWLGSPLAPGGGLGPFSFSGRLEASGEAVRFSGAKIRLDDTNGQGEGELRLGARPKLTATLDLERLGLDPYLGGASGGAAPPGEARVPGAEGSSWSRAPIDFSGLQAVDADLTLSAGAIVRDKLEIGRSRLDVRLEGGRLSAELTEMALYGGQGTGAVVLDGTGGIPEVSARFKLTDLNAGPFLSAAADFDWIEGRVGSELDVTARGVSEYELIADLNGTARFDFADGAIRGLNIPRMVRGLTVDTLLGWAENPKQKTDFSALGASFQITRGIAASEDLALIGPLVRMSGAGRVDMPERSLDWRLEPRVVASLEGGAPVPRGKGEARDLEGLGVPVVVRGSWDRPQIYPDIKGILEDPQAALKQLESLGGGLFKSLGGGAVSGGSLTDAATNAANEALQRATGGSTNIDVQKVIEGDVDDSEVLEAVEQGFGLPSGFLGSFGLGKRQQPQQEQPENGEASDRPSP
ncbi:AsmA family protein [Stappia sp.]|uniref:AsmA family protein n=1 Tax=Stappia sp. TaxID=1870903 RepID=UPI003A991128